MQITSRESMVLPEMLPLPIASRPLVAPSTPPHSSCPSATGEVSPGTDIRASSIAARGGVQALLEHIRSLSYYVDQIVHVHTFPARDAVYASLSTALAPSLQAAVDIVAPKLYSHQAKAIDALLEGHHVAIATSTASGIFVMVTLCDVRRQKLNL